jgi:hypothetical protein
MKKSEINGTEKGIMEENSMHKRKCRSRTNYCLNLTKTVKRIFCEKAPFLVVKLKNYVNLERNYRNKTHINNFTDCSVN